MIKRIWSFLGIVLLSAIATISAARLSFTNEGLVFRKACSILDRVRSGVTYADCRRELFANATKTDAEVIVLGDSITERQDWALNFPSINIANRGISGSETRDVLKAIDVIKPDAKLSVALLIGANDIVVKHRKASETIEDFEIITRKLANRIIGSSDHRIIVQSVILCHSSEPLCTPEVRAEITKLNDLIKRLSAKQGLTFIDLNSTLAPTGTLETALSDDGLHLNAAGNLAWAKLLEPALLGALARKPS
jgi:lysophospholipase L1-like esterase